MKMCDEHEQPFAPFTRTGTGPVTLFHWLTIVILAPLAPIRLLLVVLILGHYLLTVTVVVGWSKLRSYSVTRGFTAPLELSAFQRTLINGYTRYGSRVLLFIMGFWYIDVREIGPPLSEETAKIIVVNHLSYLDIFILFSCGRVSFLAKGNIPWLSAGLKVTSCMFTDRDSRDRGSSSTTAAIVARLKSKEDFPPLVIFPEGTTSNGTCVLPFKTGAFSPMVAVQPVALSFPHSRFNPSWETIRPHVHVAALLTQWYNALTITVLPVLEPAESPAAFAAQAREVIARALGVPLSPFTLEHKVLYHKRLLGQLSEDQVRSELIRLGKRE